MNAREHILQCVRQRQPPAHPAPVLPQQWITFEDRQQQFRTAVERVGGACMVCPTWSEMAERLQGLPTWKDAADRCCLVPELAPPGWDLNSISDPHDLAQLEMTVVQGQFGVAENGAIWVTDQGVRHRAAFFITQHLAIVLPADQLVDHMHQAYERVRLERGQYGVFISGPSKTADIEQSLVIGAHGARSLHVLLYEHDDRNRGG